MKTLWVTLKGSDRIDWMIEENGRKTDQYGHLHRNTMERILLRWWTDLVDLIKVADGGNVRTVSRDEFCLAVAGDESENEFCVKSLAEGYSVAVPDVRMPPYVEVSEDFGARDLTTVLTDSNVFGRHILEIEASGMSVPCRLSRLSVAQIIFEGPEALRRHPTLRCDPAGLTWLFWMIHRARSPIWDKFIIANAHKASALRSARNY